MIAVMPVSSLSPCALSSVFRALSEVSADDRTLMPDLFMARICAYTDPEM